MVAVTLGEGGMGQWPMCPPLNCTQLANLGEYSKKFLMAFSIAAYLSFFLPDILLHKKR